MVFLLVLVHHSLVGYIRVLEQFWHSSNRVTVNKGSLPGEEFIPPDLRLPVGPFCEGRGDCRLYLV